MQQLLIIFDLCSRKTRAGKSSRQHRCRKVRFSNCFLFTRNRKALAGCFRDESVEGKLNLGNKAAFLNFSGRCLKLGYRNKRAVYSGNLQIS